MLPRLDSLTLRVLDPEGQRRFYRDVIGMSDLESGRVGFSEGEMALAFAPASTPYEPSPSDLYWKIALSVPDLDLAFTQLVAKGVDVTEPRQFRDVGYLAKFTDPEGFSVELIDHHFQGDRPATALDETLLGGGAHLSLLTLRSSDITAIEPDILDWGMVPLSVQPVEPFGFTLYFYAFTDERPPNPDLNAVENRTWTYQRPYTVLEIQHVYDLEQETLPEEGAAGYAGASYVTQGADFRSDALQLATKVVS
ncbi:MAG: VOC family protein [Paracoccaceae bacterium]